MQPYFLPIAAGLWVYKAHLWPSYVPDEVAYVCCALPIAIYMAAAVFEPFNRISQPFVCGGYWILAGLTIAKGIEDDDITAIGMGAMIALLAIVIAYADTFRYGYFRGIPWQNIVFALMAMIVGIMGAATHWGRVWPNFVIPIAAVPLVVCLIYDHASTRYWGAGYCLLLATVWGLEALGNPDLLPSVVMALAGAYLFLQGRFEPHGPPREIRKAMAEARERARAEGRLDEEGWGE